MLDLAQNENRPKNRYTLLHLICGQGGYVYDLLEIDIHRVQMLSRLLELGADREIVPDNYETPLHLAAQYDRTNVAQHLLDKGANTNARDQYNRTPFHPIRDFKIHMADCYYGYFDREGLG